MRNVLPTEWNPIAVGNLQKELGSFRNWTLCGGYSVDHWAGRNTRPEKEAKSLTAKSCWFKGFARALLIGKFLSVAESIFQKRKIESTGRECASSALANPTQSDSMNA